MTAVFMRSAWREVGILATVVIASRLAADPLTGLAALAAVDAEGVKAVAFPLLLQPAIMVAENATLTADANRFESFIVMLHSLVVRVEVAMRLACVNHNGAGRRQPLTVFTLRVHG